MDWDSTTPFITVVWFQEVKVMAYILTSCAKESHSAFNSSSWTAGEVIVCVCVCACVRSDRCDCVLVIAHIVTYFLMCTNEDAFVCFKASKPT